MNLLANPYFWIAAGSAVLSGFFALVSICLRSFRRLELQKAFGGDERRLAALERHLPALRLMSGFLRSTLNLLLAVAMVFLFEGEGERHDWGLALWAILAAGVVMGVLGVAIPNAWAVHGGEKVLAGTLGLLIALRYLLWPVLAALGAFDTPVRRLAGAGEPAPPQTGAKHDILKAASEGQAEGAVRPEEARMIRAVMHFAEIRAGSIMTPRTEVFALPADTPCQDACRQVAAAGHSRVPVYQGGLDNVLGVLYAKDLLQQSGMDPQAPVRSIVRKAFFVPQTKPLLELLREFQGRKVHVAVVLDEYGGTAGVVSIEDILEEIVGEISDEYDVPAPEMVRRVSAGTAEVDGRATIDALNEALGLHIPPGEDYATAAGLVLAELGYIPSAGETVQVGPARFTVLAATPRQITRLRVEVLSAQGAGKPGT